MLELIVLGEIPGTGIVITFSWAVTILTVATGFALLRYIRKGRTIAQLVTIEETTI